MCLIAFSWQPEKDTPLTLVANRDEFFRRKTAMMARWYDQPDIIAGRDLEAMGTWLGVNAGNGRFAALTNIRRPIYRKSFDKSRGRLVSGFLQSSLPADRYLDAVSRERSSYGGFNLLVFDGKELYHLNSEQLPRPVEPGLHGLSNAGLDSCGWPKVDSARKKLQCWLEQPGSLEDLTLLLNSRALASPDTLPDTGVDPLEEHRLSAEFIAMDGYGTRCSTGLVWEKDQIRLSEINFDSGGQITGQVKFQIKLKKRVCSSTTAP
jgi:uncharacterized protein with NRDE domain